MAITRKPMAQQTTSHVDVEALINKGGSVATTAKPEAEDVPVPITLRIPAQLLTKIDATLTSRPIKKPRHTWLLEAIVEKLSRESQ